MTLAQVRALIVIGVLSVVAITTVSWAIAQDGQTGPRAADKCQAARTPTTLPPPKSVKVRVLNATDLEGLAGTAAKDLRQAGFTVVATGNDPRPVDASAQVRFGPKGLAAASLLRAYVKGAEAVQDDKRKDAVVELVLGEEYHTTGITKAAEVKAELASLEPLVLETDEEC